MILKEQKDHDYFNHQFQIYLNQSSQYLNDGNMHKLIIDDIHFITNIKHFQSRFVC